MAFPLFVPFSTAPSNEDNEDGIVVRGMTLREWYIGCALQGLGAREHLLPEEMATRAILAADKVMELKDE